MKLLVVDDEPLLRQGLVKTIERLGLPIEIAGQAEDGLRALDRVADGKPDIVITDIRMPEMNGLDFIREAKKRNEKLQFIIISGYEEFEYAKTGMQYGVTDYLLKPVDRDELQDSLIRIISRIEEDRLHASLSRELLHLQRRSDESLRERQLTKLVEQGGDAGAAGSDEKLASLQAVCREFAVVVFDVRLPVLPHRSFRAGDEGLLRFAVANIISQSMEQQGREGTPFHHSIHDSELIFVAGDAESMHPPSLRKELHRALESLYRYLHLEAAATVGVGLPVRRLGDIHHSYQQAKQALRDRIIHGPGKVYAPAPAAGGKEYGGSVIAEEEERLIFRLLNDCNGAAIGRWLGRRIEAIVQQDGASYTQVESFCINLHMLFRKYLLTQTNAPEWIIGEIDDVLAWLHGIDSWTEIEKKQMETVNAMIEHLKRLNRSSHADMMEEVRRFIDMNLHEPLSLQTIADRFFIHPNYFSRKFKERFRISFIGYMRDARIRKARELLRETELQIQDIAEIVGFPDAAYFSSVFRKTTGKTPIQYRQESRSER